MSRPRLMSRFLVRQGICRPSVSRSLIKQKPVWRPCLTAIKTSAPRWARSRKKGGSPAAHRPAPAHPQVRLPPAASAGLGSRHWPRWRRCSGQWPRRGCWSRGSLGRCRRSRPEAIMRCARIVLSDRAADGLAVTHQGVELLSHTGLSCHSVAQQGFKARQIQLGQQQPEGRVR